MRTIIVPTDFSEASKNAAYYALNLANILKANIELCHAFTLPSDNPMLGQVAWVVYEYPELLEANNKGVRKEAKALEEEEKKLLGNKPFPFHPSINYVSEAGETAKIINRLASQRKTVLIVMGMKGAGPVDRFLFGSNSLKMIETSKHPLLFIPANYKYKSVERIAFATDLNKEDIKVAQSLLTFAEYFNAELSITYILQSNNDVMEDESYERKKDLFFKDLNGKVCYHCIYSENIDYGLDILKNRDVDMLVMRHHHKNFFEKIISGSHSKKQAHEVKIPLLIIPDDSIMF